MFLFWIKALHSFSQIRKCATQIHARLHMPYCPTQQRKCDLIWWFPVSSVAFVAVPLISPSRSSVRLEASTPATSLFKCGLGSAFEPVASDKASRTRASFTGEQIAERAQKDGLSQRGCELTQQPLTIRTFNTRHNWKWSRKKRIGLESPFLLNVKILLKVTGRRFLLRERKKG